MFVGTSTETELVKPIFHQCSEMAETSSGADKGRICYYSYDNITGGEGDDKIIGCKQLGPRLPRGRPW